MIIVITINVQQLLSSTKQCQPEKESTKTVRTSMSMEDDQLLSSTKREAPRRLEDGKLMDTNQNPPQNTLSLPSVASTSDQEDDESSFIFLPQIYYSHYMGEDDSYKAIENKNNVDKKLSLKKFDQIPIDLRNLCFGFQRLQSNYYNLSIPTMITSIITLFAISKIKYPITHSLSFKRNAHFTQYRLKLFERNPILLCGVTHSYNITFSKNKLFHMIRFLLKNNAIPQELRWIDIYPDEKNYLLNNGNEKQTWLHINNDNNNDSITIEISVHLSTKLCHDKCFENHKLIQIQLNNNVIIDNKKFITSDMESIALYLECYGNDDLHRSTRFTCEEKYCDCFDDIRLKDLNENM